jgi:hypothetical protein
MRQLYPALHISNLPEASARYRRPEEDLRPLPLSLRKTNLARLLARRPDGIFVAPSQGMIRHKKHNNINELH